MQHNMDLENFYQLYEGAFSLFHNFQDYSNKNYNPLAIAKKYKTMEFFELIRTGNIEEVKQKLTENPSLADKKDPKGFSPLVLATYHDQSEIAEILIDSGANINAQDAAGNTALMGVCFKGHPEILEILINKGADIDVQNHNGATALIYAVTFNQQKIVEILVEKGADKSLKDLKGNTAYTHAQMQGFPDLAKLVKE